MNRIVTLPPIETFDDGELKEPKKLALKTLEESAELVEAVKSDDREHIIEELGDRHDDAGYVSEERRPWSDYD